MLPDTAPLHELVREMWRLARALPLAPLREFEKRTRGLLRTTEAERLVVQRVGQNVFRAALMDYWGGRCAITGCGEPLLLRASHIKPWALCETDAERLDVYNGLLLVHRGVQKIHAVCALVRPDPTDRGMQRQEPD